MTRPNLPSQDIPPHEFWSPTVCYDKHWAIWRTNIVVWLALVGVGATMTIAGMGAVSTATSRAEAAHEAVREATARTDEWRKSVDGYIQRMDHWSSGVEARQNETNDKLQRLITLQEKQRDAK